MNFNWIVGRGMISSRGRPLTPETKKLLVSVKLYFDGKRFKPAEPSVKRTAEPSVKRTADALDIGVATVKRVMADYNRDPKLLEESAKMRGCATTITLTHRRQLHLPIFDDNYKPSSRLKS